MRRLPPRRDRSGSPQNQQQQTPMALTYPGYPNGPHVVGTTGTALLGFGGGMGTIPHTIGVSSKFDGQFIGFPFPALRGVLGLARSFPYPNSGYELQFAGQTLLQTLTPRLQQQGKPLTVSISLRHNRYSHIRFGTIDSSKHVGPLVYLPTDPDPQLSWMWVTRLDGISVGNRRVDVSNGLLTFGEFVLSRSHPFPFMECIHGMYSWNEPLPFEQRIPQGILK